MVLILCGLFKISPLVADSSIERVAYHETAHVVVALILETTRVPWLARIGTFSETTFKIDLRREVNLIHEAAVQFAGVEQERIMGVNSCNLAISGEKDFKQWQKFSRDTLNLSHQEAIQKADEGSKLARRILLENADIIEIFATELRRLKELKSEDFSRLMIEALAKRLSRACQRSLIPTKSDLRLSQH